MKSTRAVTSIAIAADVFSLLLMTAALCFLNLLPSYLSISASMLSFLGSAFYLSLYACQQDGKPRLHSVQSMRARCLAAWLSAWPLLLEFQAIPLLLWIVVLPAVQFFLQWLAHALFKLPVHPLVDRGKVPAGTTNHALGLSTPFRKGLKNGIDRCLALILLVLAAPLFILIACLVKLTSDGPVLYFSWRLGKDGIPFKLIKFRTMTREAEEDLQSIMDQSPMDAIHWQQHFKLKDDPRITPWGTFLRKTSLDELPQLWNVIRGDMALVGPRPIVEAESPLYGESFPVFTSVKPGITGLWQVSGRNDLTYPQRVSLDVFYIQNWSPWLDAFIMLQTIAEILRAHGR